MARRNSSHTHSPSRLLQGRRHEHDEPYETRGKRQTERRHSRSPKTQSVFSSDERTTCSCPPPPPPNSITNYPDQPSHEFWSDSSSRSSTCTLDRRRHRDATPAYRDATLVEREPAYVYRDGSERDVRTAYRDRPLRNGIPPYKQRTRLAIAGVQTDSAREETSMESSLKVIHRAHQLAQLRRQQMATSPVSFPVSPVSLPVSPVSMPVSPYQDENRSLMQLIVQRCLWQVLTPVERWIGCPVLNRRIQNAKCQASVQVPEQNMLECGTEEDFTQTTARHPFDHCLQLVRHEPVQLRVPSNPPAQMTPMDLERSQSIQTNNKREELTLRPKRLQKTMALHLSPRELPTSPSPSQPSPLDLTKMKLTVENATCQTVANKFATVNITALWVVADFSFLRQLAKCNELPGKDPSAIESQLFGADFSLEKSGGRLINYRFAFRLRCLPYGCSKIGANRKGNVGVYLDCEELDVQETADGKVWTKTKGYVGRSLVSVALVNNKSQTMEKTVVEHIFGSAIAGKSFAFPKYLSVKNDRELSEFQASAGCDKALAFRVVYKALIAPLAQNT